MSLVAPRYCFNSQGQRHCGFHTWAQCQAARHGLGGGASENPARRGRRLGASGMEHVINAPAQVANWPGPLAGHFFIYRRDPVEIL
jgi:hypothetical protein